jgi:hypothetical protein
MQHKQQTAGNRVQTTVSIIRIGEELKELLLRCPHRIFMICDAGCAVNIDAFKIGEFSWQLIDRAPGKHECCFPPVSNVYQLLDAEDSVSILCSEPDSLLPRIAGLDE